MRVCKRCGKNALEAKFAITRRTVKGVVYAYQAPYCNLCKHIVYYVQRDRKKPISLPVNYPEAFATYFASVSYNTKTGGITK